MASNADGSIRIDTELDNSGFQRGSDKLLDALKRLQSSVDAISDTLSNGMDAVIKTMQALASQAGSTVQTVSQAADANQRLHRRWGAVAVSGMSTPHLIRSAGLQRVCMIRSHDWLQLQILASKMTDRSCAFVIVWISYRVRLRS